MNDIKLGSVICFDNEPYIVQYTQHVQMGRGGAILRTKLKNLISGHVLERTFKGGDRLEEADLNRSQVNFLYQKGDEYYFMDNGNYEQFSLPKEQIGEISRFVKEGQDVDILTFNEKPVSVNLPLKVELKVTSAPLGVKGDTAQGRVNKKVTLETGLTVDAPLFIKEGDIIRINTESGEYIERA